MAILQWMSLEDHSATLPTLLGLFVSSLVAFRHAALSDQPVRANLRLVLNGLGIGLGTSLTAALLMLLKTGWHGHLFPDFPLGMIVDVLVRAPAWGAAGMLVGLGALLACHTLRPRMAP
ncbi:MAG: hypothetical protein IPK19_02720 [Chloroflexi bacterium]|nr:hypothetical protein [Chloroflexota bacterium]